MNYTGIPTSSGTGGYDSGIAPASRIHSSLHHPALMRMLTLPINWDLIDYIVDCVVEIVNNASVKSTLSGFTSTRPLKNAYFVNFVQNVLTKSRVGMSTLLVTLSYIDRVRSKLVITHREWACERVFLGALILARKYTIDGSVKVKEWAACTGVFDVRDINRIEREFLFVIGYDLSPYGSLLLPTWILDATILFESDVSQHRTAEFCKSTICLRDYQAFT
ncbi:hypothetical protein AcV5_000557 [Taiwanofungus camphoratus]|nr:hypothetical protein AcV5_000557 [Antrodia cinnamomea]